MSTVYIGTLTLADVLPGVRDVLARINAAIAAMQSAVGQLTASLNLQVDGLGTAKASIRLAALADLQAQLDASLDLGLSLGITDPVAAIQGLLAGLISVQADVALELPALALSVQVAANLALTAELTAKIAAFDLVLSALLNIGNALGQISLALSAAVNINVTPLNLSASVALFVYDGAASSIGASLQAAITASGALPSGASVHAPVLVVNAADTVSTASLDLVVRVA